MQHTWLQLYTLSYDDDTVEKNVPASLIRSVGPRPGLLLFVSFRAPSPSPSRRQL